MDKETRKPLVLADGSSAEATAGEFQVDKATAEGRRAFFFYFSSVYSSASPQHLLNSGCFSFSFLISFLCQISGNNKINIFSIFLFFPAFVWCYRLSSSFLSIFSFFNLYHRFSAARADKNMLKIERSESFCGDYRNCYGAAGRIKWHNYIYWTTMGGGKEKDKEKFKKRRRGILSYKYSQVKNLHNNLYRLYQSATPPFLWLLLYNFYFSAICTACFVVWMLSIFSKTPIISTHPKAGKTASPADASTLHSCSLPLLFLIAK